MKIFEKNSGHQTVFRNNIQLFLVEKAESGRSLKNARIVIFSVR